MTKHLTVSEFMSSKVTSVKADDTLCHVVKTMQKQNISCVIVHDEHTVEESNTIDSLLGFITERDIVRFIAKQTNIDTNAILAKSITPPTLVTINKNDSLFEAMVLCRSQRTKHLAVIDDQDSLAGIITYSDLVDANCMQIESQVEMLGDSAQTMEDLNAQLMEMSLTDPLLKIGNRRSMDIDLKQTLELSERYKRNFSITLLDIDFFKNFNDHYGHQKGDEALIAVSDILSASIRTTDRLYRYGGEEFLLLMPETNEEGAMLVSERMVKSVEKENIVHEKSPFGSVTISTGTSAFDAHATGSKQNTHQLVEAADQALYEAKSSGRNKAMLASSP